MKNAFRLSILAALVAGSLATAQAAPESSPSPILLARQGADDPAGHVRRGRGNDNAPGDDRRAKRQGADDPAGDLRRGRGNDNLPGDDRGAKRGGADDPAGDVRRGRGKDNTPGDDRGTA